VSIKITNHFVNLHLIYYSIIWRTNIILFSIDLTFKTARLIETVIIRKYFFRVGLLLTILVLNGFNLYPQCKIQASATKLCKGNSVTFLVSSLAARYEWNSGDGNTESQRLATFMYKNYGVFKARVVLYDNTNKIICKDSVIITVYDLPTANMLISDSIEICYGNNYCFNNTSVPGANKALINQYLWLFGDGDMSGLKFPCHKYDISGDYLVYLNVRDSNKCESKIEKKVHVTVGSSMRPVFYIVATDSCPVTKALFIPVMDTIGKKIKKFILNFGDGSKDSSVTLKTFSHTYTKAGVFEPFMTVVNKTGCAENYFPQDSVINTILSFKYNITATNPVTCYDLNRVRFNQPSINNVSRLLWNFGDSMAGSYNYNTTSWSPIHIYTNPGNYSVSLHIEASYCRRDTILCNLVRIKGPRALINLPGVTNNCMRNRLLPRDKFIYASSKCYNPNDDPISYARLFKVNPYVKQTIDTFCNADTLKFSIVKSTCKTDTVYTLKPTGKKKIYDTISVFYEMWYPGDTIPTGKIYYRPSGSCNSQVMHDTDFFPLNCSAPNYVRFTNNSIKFRNSKAIDDKPPFIAGTLGSDQCKNRSWPWASDSMQYTWDFGDKYAVNCTSTVINKNINCKYSTEVAPWHLYKKDGCFTAYLKVYDPVTNCTSLDSLKISMQQPSASWDTSVYDYLDYISQGLSPPVLPRRGLQLIGIQCTQTPQTLNLSEILPQCILQDWGVVFDSAEDCKTICTDTAYLDYNRDGKTDTFYLQRDTCKWITKAFYDLNYSQNGYIYTKPGCKTIGLWVKSGDCIDTFWYHDYKYFSRLESEFEILDANDSLKQLYSGSCPPVKPVFVIPEIYRNQYGIVSFKFEISKLGSTTILYQDSCKLIRDTILVLADKLNPGLTFNYPAFACPDEPLNKIKLSDLLKKYTIKDSVLTLSLEDTIFAKYVLNEPASYEFRGYIKNINGCEAYSMIKLGVGFTTAFSCSDTMLCLGDSAVFSPNISYYGFGSIPHNYNLEWDFNGDGINDTGTWYKYSKPGLYTIKMKYTDSFCQSGKVIEHKNYVVVGGVKAAFDTTNSPSNCAPQVVGFKDKTVLLTPWISRYDSLGHFIDSVLIDQIAGWLWDFGDHKGQHSLSYKQNPVHAYTSNGQFDVSLIVISALGCYDTLIKPRYIIIDGPKPEFDLLDTLGCVVYKARVVDTSTFVTDWIWQLGDKTQVSGTYHKGDTVILTYKKPGVYYPYLVGYDSVYNVYLKTYTRCTAIYPNPNEPDYKPFKVTVLPINLLNFTGDTVLCSGETVSFTDRSDTAYKEIYWDFGDNSTTTTNHGAVVNHMYSIFDNNTLAFYNLEISGNGSPCPDQPKTKLVTVKKVIADVEWDSTLSDDPVFCFRNFSRGGIKYEWRFAEGRPYFIRANDTNYRCTNYYIDKGKKLIQLKAYNDIGCIDTDSTEVENNYEVMIEIPNVFTPGTEDLVNDSFTIKSKNIEWYNLTIYNRWGDVVFQSFNKDKHWDGNDIQSGKPCSAGTYFFVLEYKFKYLEPERAAGTATLIR
jgi:gliding motility-associated-like protein